MTDRLPCFFIINYPSKIPKQRRPKVRVYNKLSKQNCIRDLERVEWSPVYNDKNPNSSFKTFLDTCNELHDKNFPLETLAKKSKQNLWLKKDLNRDSF